jgi:hypothetical protein
MDGAVLDSVNSQLLNQFGTGIKAFIDRRNLMNMKLPTFAFVTVAVALGIWSSSAQVIPGPNSPFEKINFSLIIQQQGVTWGRLSKGYGYYWTVKTMRMGNKGMLKYFADAFHTQWPPGAHLAMLTDTRDIFPVPLDLYVLDKDGNILNSAEIGWVQDETNRANFVISEHVSLKAGKYTDGWPVETDNVKRYQLLYFQLYRNEDTNPAVYTDLNFQGVDTETYCQKSSYYTNSVSITERIPVNGEGMMNGTWTVVSGHVTFAGKWVSVF